MAAIPQTSRCSQCKMRHDLCFCSLIPSLPVISTRITIVMHVAEINKPSNTARLVASALPQTEIRLQGLDHRPLDFGGILSPERTTCILFPDATSELGEILPSKKPITLIVPDGTWRQARKLAALCTQQLGVQRVRVQPDRRSQYKLRLAERGDQLCTLEAIALALEAIENSLYPQRGTEVRTQLESLLHIMRDRVLQTRRGRGLSES